MAFRERAGAVSSRARREDFRTRRVEVREIGADCILGVETDSLDVPRVVALPLRRRE